MLRDPDGRFSAAWHADPFDPRGWPEPLPYTTLWLDPANGIFCVLDTEDYQWALQWHWGVIWDRHGRKAYASRSTRILGRHHRYYLHKEILIRAGSVAPTKRHIISDHLNGNSLDCRRRNLRWATPSMNRLNIGGSAWWQESLGV